MGSFRTPLGRHRICAKIGDGLPPNTIFRARKPAGLWDGTPTDEDLILGRILWLEGLETGVNRRGQVDTKLRYIYIHGTPHIHLLGRPASSGCIRMAPVDMLDLFEHARVGERVYIRP